MPFNAQNRNGDFFFLMSKTVIFDADAKAKVLLNHDSNDIWGKKPLLSDKVNGTPKGRNKRITNLLPHMTSSIGQQPLSLHHQS